MTDVPKNVASSYLIDFLEKFSGLMEEQLTHVRSEMEKTVDTVLAGVEGISNTTEEHRQNAEIALEDTYLNPDAETEVLVDDLQKMISEVFDSAKAGLNSEDDMIDLSSSKPDLILENRLKRFERKFSGKMQNVQNLDNELSQLLIGLMGALSSEDVIAQRLEHVIMALKVLQTGLSYILIDFNQRCTVDELTKVTTDIKNYTYRQYTTEDEKNEFHTYFPVKAGI